MTASATHAVLVENLGVETHFQLGCSEHRAHGAHRESSQAGSDIIAVSRSQLTGGMNTLLSQSDQRMHVLVSSLRMALQQAEDDLKRYTANRENRFHVILNEAVKPHVGGGHTPKSTNDALSFNPHRCDSPVTERSPCSTPGRSGGTNSGTVVQTKSNITGSDISVLATQKREAVRRDYAGIHRWSINFESKKRSRLAPCYWVQEQVLRCLSLVYYQVNVNRLNCISAQYIIDTKEFVAWVCVMILSNAVYMGLSTDLLIKRVHCSI